MKCKFCRVPVVSTSHPLALPVLEIHEVNCQKNPGRIKEDREVERLLPLYGAAFAVSSLADSFPVDLSGDAEEAYGTFTHELDAAVGKLKEALERMEVL